MCVYLIHSSSIVFGNLWISSIDSIQMQVFCKHMAVCLKQANRTTWVKWNEMKYIIFNHSYRIVSFDSIVSSSVANAACVFTVAAQRVTVDRCQGNNKLWSAYSIEHWITHIMHVHNLYNILNECCNNNLVNCIELPTLNMLDALLTILTKTSFIFHFIFVTFI